MDTSHQVLFRKYRPQKFSDVVFQDLAVSALTNAIKTNKVGHAYIFIGPRGVGKTTIARILAKRLNCENPDGAEPCNSCNSCLEIVKGISGDVIEIDAASHSSVDNIRDLRENVKFNALGGRFRVFILDEVHMLSTQAFNALLKTLEEPPPHIVFVLATTEFHKIPETILSRCQDFHFKKVPDEELETLVQKISDKEGFKCDSEGLFWIAKRGDGSVRDTLSFMEQAVIFTDGQLLGTKIRKMVGYYGIEGFMQLLDATLDFTKQEAIFVKIEQIFEEGIDLQKFIWDYVEFLHSVLFLKDQIIDKQSTQIPQTDLLKLKAHYRDISQAKIILISERVFAIYEKITHMKLRTSYEVKVFLEIQFKKLISELEKPSVAGLVQRLNDLAQMLQSDKPYASTSIESNKNLAEEKKIENKSNLEVENLIKEQFSGMEVDPSSFKNL